MFQEVKVFQSLLYKNQFFTEKLIFRSFLEKSVSKNQNLLILYAYATLFIEGLKFRFFEILTTKKTPKSIFPYKMIDLRTTSCTGALILGFYKLVYQTN